MQSLLRAHGFFIWHLKLDKLVGKEIYNGNDFLMVEIVFCGR